MTCWNCGKKISEHILFCPHCGKMQAAANKKTYSDKDPFEVLQISKDAEEEVIKAAYRSLARKYHPDTNPTPEAEEKMKEITWAFELLSDKDRRQQWKHRNKEAKRKEPQEPPKPKSDRGANFVTCPVCGKRHDRTLGECPACQYEKAKRKKANQKKVWWFLGISLISCGIFLVTSILNASNSSNSSNQLPSSDFPTNNQVLSQKPTAKERKPAATRTPLSIPSDWGTPDPLSDCVRWDQISIFDVGRETCVYGRVVEVRENLTADGYYEYVIRFSIPDKFLFKSIRVYYPSLVSGLCVAMIGQVKESPHYYYMQSQALGDVEIYELNNCE